MTDRSIAGIAADGAVHRNAIRPQPKRVDRSRFSEALPAELRALRTLLYRRAYGRPAKCVTSPAGSVERSRRPPSKRIETIPSPEITEPPCKRPTIDSKW
jgi:hypothetical protein